MNTNSLKTQNNPPTLSLLSHSETTFIFRSEENCGFFCFVLPQRTKFEEENSDFMSKSSGVILQYQFVRGQKICMFDTSMHFSELHQTRPWPLNYFE